jgi:hypothetical protein
MALNFPNDPTLNEEVELAGKTYKWDGEKWRMVYVITPPPPTATTAAPTITIISEDPTGVTFTLTNNDDNTAVIVYEIDTTQDFVELAAAATSTNITVALAVGTYTLSAFATVVGEVATQSTAAVEIIVIPAYEELFSTTVATAVTEIDITGLSIGKDDTLRLVYTFVHDVEAWAEYRLFVNDDTTQSNYQSQFLGGSGSSISALRFSNNAFLASSRNNRRVQGIADIKISNNDRFVFQSQYMRTIGTNSASLEQQNFNTVNTTTKTSITKLSISSDVTNGIRVGSKIALYKVTEAA